MSKTPTDIEIAQSAKMQPITEIAQKLGLSLDNIELYGKYKAKLTMEKVRDLESEKDGNPHTDNRYNPNTCRRGKDHSDCRAYRRSCPNRQKDHGMPQGAFIGAELWN